jgi:hypothetical protein
MKNIQKFKTINHPIKNAINITDDLNKKIKMNNNENNDNNADKEYGIEKSVE